MAQQAPRRTACDRCRAHKLRCPPPERPGRGPCTRCVRASVACVTSGAKPTGRPRKTRGAVLGDEPVADLAELARISAASGPLLEPVLVPEINGAGGMPWMNADLADLLAQHTADVLHPWPAFEQLQHQTINLDLPNTEVPALGTAANPGANLNRDEEHALLPDHPSREDILVALSRLSESISQQLSRSKEFQHERDAPAATTRPPPPVPSVNGVTVALKCTSDFTKVLQTLPPHAGTKQVQFNNDSLSPIDTPTALLVLSNYTQLTHLYDTIFRCLCRIFRENPDAIGTCPASADSQFQVAGLSGIDGRLYVKLLIGVIEHHIEGVDKLLGLPAALAASGLEIKRDGVLGGDELQGIVDLALSRKDDPGGSGKERIMSLRGAIKEVKELL